MWWIEHQDKEPSWPSWWERIKGGVWRFLSNEEWQIVIAWIALVITIVILAFSLLSQH